MFPICVNALKYKLTRNLRWRKSKAYWYSLALQALSSAKVAVVGFRPCNNVSHNELSFSYREWRASAVLSEHNVVSRSRSWRSIFWGETVAKRWKSEESGCKTCDGVSIASSTPHMWLCLFEEITMATPSPCAYVTILNTLGWKVWVYGENVCLHGSNSDDEFSVWRKEGRKSIVLNTLRDL